MNATSLHRGLHAVLRGILSNAIERIQTYKPRAAEAICMDEQRAELVAAAAALLVEEKRAAVVTELRRELERLVTQSCDAQHALQHNQFRKTMNSLFPSWALTAANFEWTRGEPGVCTAADDAATASDAAFRSWVCPLYDVGCEVRDATGDTSDSLTVAPWEAATASDDFCLCCCCGGAEAPSPRLPLSSLRLVTPKPFCRDALIPALEDEPAGRCGNSALYARLRFTLKVPDDGTLVRLMRRIADAATEARLDILRFAANLHRAGGAAHDRIVAACDASRSRSIAVAQRISNDVIRIRVAPSLSDSSDDGDVCGDDSETDHDRFDCDVSVFHFLKLRALFAAAQPNLGVFIQHEDERTAPSGELMSMLLTNFAVESADTDVASVWCDATDKHLLLQERSNSDTLDVKYRACLLRMCTLLRRYRTLDGGPGASSYANMHAAIHPAFAGSVVAVGGIEASLLLAAAAAAAVPLPTTAPAAKLGVSCGTFRG